MKRLLILMLIPLLTISLSATAKITFEKTDIDFGDLESGKTADLEFHFTSSGDETLVIKNISSSCGCTVSKVDKTEYKPGEKGIIPVKFFSRGYNGKVVKTITVSTNDPDNVYARLKIEGNVVLKDFAELTLISPDRIDFKDVPLGEKRTETVKFKNSGSIELRIIEVVHSPEINLEFSKVVLGPDEEAEIHISFKAMQVGRFASFPRLRTNAYRQRSVIFKINADVKEK